MATVNWSGVNGDWTTTNDWTGNSVPGIGDTAAISSGTVTVSLLDSASTGEVDVGGVSVTGGTLSIAGTFVVAGSTLGSRTYSISQTGGSINLVDGGTITTGFYLSSFSGTINIDSDSEFIWNSANADSSNSVVNFEAGDYLNQFYVQQAYSGTINNFGSGDYLDFVGAITNVAYSGHTLAVTAGGKTYNLKFSGTYNLGNFVNNGYSVSYQVGPSAPTITGTVANQATISEGTVTPFSTVTVGDGNGNNPTETLTITLSGGGTLADGANFNGLTDNHNGSYTLATDTAANVTAELDALIFTPTAGVPNTSSTTSFTLSDKSSAYGTATSDGTTSVIDSDPAVAPTITGTVANQATISEGTVTPFSTVTVGDGNGNNPTETLTITLSGGGTLADGANFNGLTDNHNGSYTLATDTAANVTAELDALIFTPTAGAPNTSSTTSFTLSDKSSAYGTATSDGTTSVIDSDPAVAPTIIGTSANQATISEGTVTPFSGVTIGDTNGNSPTETLTITLSGGGTLADGANFNGLTDNHNGSYTLATDTAANVTAELDALIFTPTAGAPNTSSTTSFTLSDKSSAYGTATSDGTTSVIDSDPAVAPTIIGTSANQATISEGTVTPFSGVTIGDTNGNSPTETLTITLSGGGTLADGANFNGLTDNHNGSYTLATDTAANVTAELDALIFTPTAGVPNTSSTTSFTLSDKSSAYGTATSDGTTSVIDSDPAVAPTITGTVANQATISEGTVTPFSTVTVGDGNGNNPTETLTITLSGGGTLADGANFNGLTDNHNGSYTLATDTAANVTAELDALIFTPTAGVPNTSSTTSFTLSDKSSAYGTATSDGTTSVIDSDPAVAPTITGTVANQATISEGTVTPFSTVTVGDGNGNNPTETLTITLSGGGTLADGAKVTVGDGNGNNPTETLTITLSGGGTLADGANFNGLTDNHNGSYTLATDTAANVTAELDALIFTPTAGVPNTSSTTSFTLSDKSSAYGTATSDGTTSVIDSDPAVAPTITGTITGTVANQATISEGTVTPFSGVTIGDTNGNSPTETLTITLSGGGTLADGANFNGLTDNHNGSYTLATDTAANVTAELDALIFTPTAGVPNTSSTTSFTLSDKSSAYGTATSDGTTSVIDSDPAVAPTITGTVANQATISEGTVTPFSTVTVGDGNGNNPTDSLTITLGGTGGTLTGAGLTQNPGGTYTLASGTAASVTAALDALSFTPTAGAPNTSSTTSFTLSDKSSAFGTATTNATTSVIDSDPAVSPTITGTVANQATASEATVKPFSGVTIGDTNGNSLTETVTITLGGTGGSLTGAGLTQNPGGSYTLASGTAASVTAALDALSFTPTAGAPNTSSTTSFTLSDKSSAFGTATTNATTSVVDTDPAAPSGGGTTSGGTGPGAPTNSTPTPPSVAFDPTAIFSDSNTATLTGTVSDASGVKNVEIFEGTSDLGSATVDPTTNTWAFTYRFAPGFHTGLAALATGNDNVTASTPSSYDLTTGVTGEPYAAYQDNYDPASGAFEGQTFFTRHGALEMQTQYSPTQDGGFTVLSSGGTAFAKTPYFAVVDTYNAGGQPVEEDVYYKDGHQTVQGLKPGETLSSISNDTFYSKGGNNTFVFTPHFGQDTITSFVLGGAHHDTISLPDSAASRLGSILNHATTDAQGDTTLHLNGKDSITIQGVSVADLKQHKADFTFHA